MHFAIDADDPRPVFRQIVDEVRRGAATGVLRPDDPLPAVRQLAKDLKVNPNTVQQAYRELERGGEAYVRRGLGTFVGRPTRVPEAARRGVVARQLASRFLREGFRQGLLASDLFAALQEVAPESASAPAGRAGRRGSEPPTS
jgi:GntR family transcriptional regulator